MTVRWPDASAYAMAARETETFFTDPVLREATLQRSPLGLPLPATGRNAAVFKAQVAEGGDAAVRVFTRPPSEGPERYTAIESHVGLLEGNVFPDVHWNHEAVAVEGTLWPMVRMDWVEGETLDAWVRAHLREPDRLRDFAKRWDRLFVYLDHSHVAHGDLQHGNVLVDAEDRIRLVDLDGLWIPELESIPAPEYGHAHFQHPKRVEERVWGPRMDGFAALVIGISLVALAQKPELWDSYNDGGNNLIFLGDDFEDLGRPIWADLAAIDDRVLRGRVEKLRRACEISCAKLTGPLDMLNDAKEDPAVPGVPSWLRTTMQQRQSVVVPPAADTPAPDMAPGSSAEVTMEIQGAPDFGAGGIGATDAGAPVADATVAPLAAMPDAPVGPSASPAKQDGLPMWMFLAGMAAAIALVVLIAVVAA